MGAIRRSLVMIITLSIFTGLVYPLAMTGLAQAVFPSRANGSIIIKDGVPVGSGLIGQAFTDARYFSSRPSAGGNDAANSGGTNYGGTSAKLQQQVSEKAAAVREVNGWEANRDVPSVLVTNSSSGLDPHLTPEAAYCQVERIAKARGLSIGQVRDLVTEHIEKADLGVVGEDRVNVLKLNLALDKLQQNQ
ncbi:MAG: potassium-transporting ATPase subunit KdpC [Phascolarctobacterium sp.]|uniref:potassium-transporting ATPase subunit KdpC n=1 Tax=Phascolarctobacterium sp. TaxID=2049039 RepID=UPI0025CEE201|nr:potassium-transporting ATPase subunit KdpC [Phascolarctobacterium sp.]MCC8158446.1 potassium-transporting ATPase subunit KdpC [Phascolarctobacterium sp.]